MKRVAICLLAITIILGGVSCKGKKCADFSDPRNNYHNKYNKKGLVKSKNKQKSTWSDKY